MSQDELLELMNNDTWMDCETAKEKGFIDEILFQEEKAIASVEGMIPQKVINGVRNTLMEQKLINEDESSEKEESKEESSEGLTSKQKQEVRDIVKDEIKKQIGKEEEPKENKINNKFKRWL